MCDKITFLRMGTFTYSLNNVLKSTANCSEKSRQNGGISLLIKEKKRGIAWLLAIIRKSIY
jgi:hypothetical protein